MPRRAKSLSCLSLAIELFAQPAYAQSVPSASISGPDSASVDSAPSDIARAAHPDNGRDRGHGSARCGRTSRRSRWR